MTEDTLDLWSICLTEHMEHASTLADLLSCKEKTRAARFHSPLHAQRFIVAHGLLRQILSRYTDTAPDQLIFASTPHEKPFLQAPAGLLQFNLSHSEDRLLIAVTSQVAVGVDIEKIRSDVDHGIAERYFHPDAYARLKALPEAQRVPAFFQLWTGKEAVIKMTGKGLAHSLATFSLEWANRQSVTLKTGQPCHLTALAIAPDYAAAVAVGGHPPRIIEKSLK